MQDIRWLPWASREKRSDVVLPRPDFSQVYAAQIDFVFAALQRLGVRDCDVEDVLQKVFIDIHQRLHTFDPSGSIEAWIYGICKHEAANYRRMAHRRREVSTDEPIDHGLEGQVPHPEDVASARQARQELESILDELDPDKRMVFVMFEIDELSCDEIAKSLGIPVGTVYSRLNAARRAFQQAVNRYRASGWRRSRWP